MPLNDAGVLVERQFRGNGVQLALGGELRQLFANIIGNALDATNAGGTIAIRVRDSSDCNGRLGFAGHHCRHRIRHERANFKAYLRAILHDKGHDRHRAGFVGHPKIVEKHQGKLRVRSSQAQHRHGTVFSLFLPADGIRPEAQVA